MSQKPTEEYRLELYILAIEIFRGVGLVSKDLNGSSDPFCVVTAEGQKYVTQVVKKNLNPTWNESTTFAFLHCVPKIKFEVFDWDKGELGKHDSMGDVTLDVSKLYFTPEKPFDGSLVLQNVKKGQIMLKVTGRQILPTDLENRIKDLTAKTNEQQSKIDKTNLEINKLTETNNKLKSEEETLNKAIEELEESKTLCEKDIKQREENIKTLTTNKEEISKQLERAKNKITDQENTNKKLQDQIDDLKKRIEESKKQGTDLRSEVATLKDDLVEKTKQCEDLQN